MHLAAFHRMEETLARTETHGWSGEEPTGGQLREIAEQKMADLNATSVEGAMQMVAGSARSMGLKVEG